MKFRFTPTRILVIYLSLMAVMAHLSWGGLDPIFWLQQLFNLSVLFIPSYLLYRILVHYGVSRKTPLDHKLITTLILFLLFDPLIPWYVFLGLGILSELIQRLIRMPSGPVLNPAAGAIALISLFNFLPGWWGVSFSPRLSFFESSVSVALFFLPIALYVAYKYHKLPLIISTFIIYGIAYFIFFMRSPLFLLIEGTIAFFIIVMVVEPKTSPIKPNQQIIFGTGVALLSTLLLKLGFLVPNAGGLVIANMLYNSYRNGAWIKKKILPQSQPVSAQ